MSNSAEYWEAQYPGSDCYKHEQYDATVHGSITNDGDAVTLAPFGQDWEQDFYSVLVVKGGSVDGGNAVYPNPLAGTPYFAPLNAGGQQSDVSHWIVCKGYTPEITTTTVVIEETTTTAPATTVPEGSNSTIPATTTPVTVETGLPPVTTTITPQLDMAVERTVLVGVPTTPPILPETGNGIALPLAAGFVTVAGLVIWWIATVGKPKKK